MSKTFVSLGENREFCDGQNIGHTFEVRSMEIKNNILIVIGRLDNGFMFQRELSELLATSYPLDVRQNQTN